MKAAVYNQYGAPEVLHLEEIIKPTPKDDEILIQIKATAVNSGDVRLRKADPFAVRFIFGLFKPRIHILGSVYSGVIERVGKEVKNYKTGDQVFGHTDMKFGGYAEYICVPVNSSIALKPESISHLEAATIPFGGVTALHFIQKANIQKGQKVLIVGALGAVGSAALQLAKSLGANVTGVCSTNQIDLVKSIGADHVIDYTKEDFTKNGEIYDVIYDSVNAISVSRSLKSLSPQGVMILSSAGMPEMIQGKWISKTSKIKVLTGVIRHSASAMAYLKDLIEAKKYKPLVDRSYPLEQLADAHAYVEKGSKKGGVSIII